MLRGFAYYVATQIPVLDTTPSEIFLQRFSAVLYSHITSKTSDQFYVRKVSTFTT